MDSNIATENHRHDKHDKQSADALLKELDRDSRSRELTGPLKKVYSLLFAAFSLYVMACSMLFSSQTEYTKLPVFVGLVLFLGYLKYPACKRDALRTNYIPWYDLLAAVLSLGCYLYYPIRQNYIIYSGGRIGTAEIIIGIIGILLLIELCRRSTGIPLIVVVGLFVAYASYWQLFVAQIPGKLFLRTMIYQLFYNIESGVFSTPISVCCSFIVLFIIFGAFLEKTGIGSLFVDMANALVGFSAGGPAKVAVISSAFVGMYSGSSVANTVGSGSFTIPAMKKVGYRPEFAAAVEAAASTGGQIMPPIMGAAAFLMAQITGVPYYTIVLSAILPAFLYFAGIFLMVHFEAKRYGLKGLPKDAIPNFFHLLVTRGYLLLPIVVLVVCMNKYTPALSACIAILVAMAVSLLDSNVFADVKQKETRAKALVSLVFALIPIAVLFLCKWILPLVLANAPIGYAVFAAMVAATVCSFFAKEAPLTPTVLLQTLESGTNSSAGVAVACGMAGIIAGVVASTGLGSALMTAILPVAQKSIFLALFLTMLCCIVLGMGVPTTANYVIMATITAPILVKMGIPLLAAHMFVFYFGIVADITPPVALAAYAGSAIAKSNPLKTGVTATKLAIGAFLVPYIFALSPDMLLIDANVWNVILIVLTSIVGMFGISTGMEGYCLRRASVIERLLLIAGGVVLVIPGWLTDVIGIVLVGGVIAYEFLKNKEEKAKTAVSDEK